MTRLLVFLLVSGAAIAGLKLLVIVLEPRMTFYPLRGEQTTPAEVGLQYEDLELRTSDAERVHAWRITPPNAVAEVVFWHGNGGNLSLWLDVLAEIARRDLAVTALDYRGYGKSSGTPTEQGLYRDTDALLRYVEANVAASGRKVIYWGRSLGGAVAAYATTVRAPDGLILEAVFPHKRAILRTSPLLNVLDRLARFEFPTSRFLAAYGGPALLIHGTEDEIVPFPLGREVYESLSARAQWLTIEGAHHNDLHLVEPDAYWRTITDFIRRVAAPEGALHTS